LQDPVMIVLQVVGSQSWEKQYILRGCAMKKHVGQQTKHSHIPFVLTYLEDP